MVKSLAAVLLFFLLSGCSGFSAGHGLYEIRMMSGDTLYAKSSPVLDRDGYYRFDDVNGQRYIINKDLVLFIEPTRFDP